jgi:2-polyprenyl-6-hydroxyphenyl methylase/3-demethylubiquinone-9 3-methyltransferase
MDTHTLEVEHGARYKFGANWQRFLGSLDEANIRAATDSLRDMLGDISGKRFLDIGSGSGLFSLAAHNLGATVHSFDYDPQSVACTAEVKRRHAPGARWVVERGSVLDSAYLAGLGAFDVVYAWGVLHHTGNMRQAFENVTRLATDKILIAIYNDQGWKSRYWHVVKHMYNHDLLSRSVLIALHAPPVVGGRYLVRALTGRLREVRGMSVWYDFFDWMGGYPFEVASVAEVRDFFAERGFTLAKVHDVSPRSGCNEFVVNRRR